MRIPREILNFLCAGLRFLCTYPRSQMPMWIYAEFFNPLCYACRTGRNLQETPPMWGDKIPNLLSSVIWHRRSSRDTRTENPPSGIPRGAAYLPHSKSVEGIRPGPLAARAHGRACPR
jgi:hypothetical protein